MAKHRDDKPQTTVTRVLATTLWVVALIGVEAMAVEEPRYEVLRTTPQLELRRYAPYIVAETTVTGDFDKVGNRGFRILADYIFGNNVSKTEMAMTAPVSQRPAEGDKIPMTAPVAQQRDPEATSADSYVVSFVMPSSYTLDTLPTPNDSRIRLREAPARLMAVRRYSGRWTHEKYDDNLEILMDAIQAANLEPVGEPIYARYNPPFTPWPLRRNEVMVEISGLEE